MASGSEHEPAQTESTPPATTAAPTPFGPIAVPTGGRAPPRLSPGAILGYQASAGNAAIARAILARDPPPTATADPPLAEKYDAAVKDGRWGDAATLLDKFGDPDVADRLGKLSHGQRIDLWESASPGLARVLDAIAKADLEAAYQGALKANRWERVAVYMNGFSDPDIEAHAAALSASERKAVRAATPEWAFRVRGPLLELDYKDALAAGNWGEAATLMNGFDKDGVTSHIAALATPQRIELWVGSPQWATRIQEGIAEVDLEAAYQGALKAKRWERVAVYMNGFSDPDIQTHAAALSPPDRKSTREATPEWAFRVRGPLLSLDYDAAVAASDWAQAAILLNGFDDPGIQTRVAALTPAQRKQMRSATPDWAARVRTPLLELDWNAAVTAGRWNEAADVLNAFNNADIATHIAALTPDQRQALMAAARDTKSIGDGSRILDAGHAGGGPAAGEIFGTVAFSGSPVSGLAGGKYEYPISITFTPNAAVCQATKIAFIQTVRIVTTGTNKNRDEIEHQEDRLNSNQQAVDRLPGMQSGWYGTADTGGALSNLTMGSCPPPVAAVLRDKPSWNKPDLTWEFETAAVAKEGPQAGLVYSVVKWGFTVDAAGTATATAVSKEDRVSGGFGTAIGEWNKQADSFLDRSKNAPGQQTLPGVR